MSLHAQLIPNRGAVASTSECLQSSTRLGWCRLLTEGRGLQKGRLKGGPCATHQQQVPVETLHSYEEEDGDWTEVWVSDNGSQVVLDSESDLPAEYPDSDLRAQRPGKKLPAEMRYFDTATIFLKAGSGGNGCVAFRREKHVPRGGPAGGNGGRGGHVWAIVDTSLNSLTSFRKQLHFRAAPGLGGRGGRKHGAAGEDIEIRLPLGTIVRRKDSRDNEPPLAELLKPGMKVLLAEGGRGGRGNASFKTGANNAPQLAESGGAGQELRVDVELKLMADVGIIGVPNAGKSTLLGVVSAAKPKVADYPFTTLKPNLGVCEMDFRTTVFADIPGLLEGAHTGTGLGHEFLRHCQRSRVLVHVIDGTSPDPVGDFSAIRTELELFNPELLNKPQVVAYNKMDLPDSSDYLEEVKGYLQKEGIPSDDIVGVSAATGHGVIDLVRRLHRVLDALPIPDDSALSTNALNLTEPPRGLSEKRMDEFRISAELTEGRVFTVEGAAVERFAQMTNWEYYEALLRFQRVLEASGITRALRGKGVKEGDTVVIGDVAFDWSDDQSKGAVYSRWVEGRKAAGQPLRGSTAWPHAG